MSSCQRGQRIMFSVVFTPPPPCHHGIVWVIPVISLFLANTVSPVQACLTFTGDISWEQYKKKRAWASYLIPRWRSHCYARPTPLRFQTTIDVKGFCLRGKLYSMSFSSQQY
jgi:hypothetical protein